VKINELELRLIIREALMFEKMLSDVMTDDQIGATVDPHPSIENSLWGTSGVAYGGNRETVKRRRDLKRLWNQHADHSYFDDPSKIFVRHYLGMYSGNSSVADYFPVGSSKPDRIPGIHVANRNELSCLASVSKDEPSSLEAHERDLSFFTFRKYRMTFASWSDVASERLSMATPAHVEKYKSSGLPKRPMAYTLPYNLPIDEEGMMELKELDEVIIDNWIVDTFYVSEAHNDPVREIKHAESLGLKWKWKREV
jgi:hypothetical protein